eukprot:NODE_148_length_17471_cov_0.413136.p5 type:complete len:317 gc:universal NODE_148_length_17471_cov_0.413136:14162-15112(+)
MQEQKPTERRQDMLRQRMVSINLDKTLTPQEKAKQMQQLMMPVQINKINKVETECEFKINGTHGCQHYQRSAVIISNCCNDLVVCRLCHDEKHSHEINRFEIDQIMCMYCKTKQKPSKSCSNCKQVLGSYYCNICHFWDNDDSKDKFHCNDCGLCRSGKQKDFYHCEVCDTCMNINLIGKHPCLEKSSHSDCPICNELLFTSVRPLTLMKCGHAIHLHCLESYLENNYQCPYCMSSVADMSDFFEKMDEMVKEHEMPEEYKHFRADILCNDCHATKEMPYHFVGHKCDKCNSWNTRVTRTWKAEYSELDQTDELVD